MQCNEALPLVWSYVDGELSEAQAQPLRKHLLECHSCRNSAQDGRSLKRWFVRSADAEQVPEGFAARVARRAFAGDTGERVVPARRTPEPRHLGYVLALTAAAAAALLALSFALRAQALPASAGLRADTRTQMDRQEVQNLLDRINASDSAAARHEAAQPAAAPAPQSNR